MPGNDEVIVEHDFELTAHYRQAPGRREVRSTRCRVSARVVVHDDESAGREVERPVDDRARREARRIDGSLEEELVGDEPVASRKEKHANLFAGMLAHVGAEISGQRRGAGDPVPLESRVAQGEA